MISDQDKWVEEKARELVKLSIYQEIGIGGCTIIGNSIDTSEAKNIILSIVKELKPVVSIEWIAEKGAELASEWSDIALPNPIPFLKRVLTEAGVEVISSSGDKL